MSSRAIPTYEQIQKVLTIPVKTHKLFLNTYNDSFTGKEAAQFLTNAFQLNSEEILEFGGYLLRGSVIEPQNNRFNTNFTASSSYVYTFKPEKKHDLFWLEETKSSTNKSNSAPDLSSPDSSIPREVLPSLHRKGKSSSDIPNSTIFNYIGKEVCTKHNGIFSTKINDVNHIILSCPKYNQLVLEHKENFVKLPEHRSNTLGEQQRSRGDHFTSSQKRLQSHYETIISKLFTPENVSERFSITASDTMQKELDQFIGQSDKDSGILDLSSFCKRVIIRLFGRLFFGIDLNSQPKYQKIFRIFLAAYDSSKGRHKGGILKGKKQSKIFKILEEIVTERQKATLRVSSTRVQNDILETLLGVSTNLDPNSSDDMSLAQSNEVISQTLMSVMYHSFSSTVSMIIWSMIFMYDASLGNSAIQLQLLQEIENLSKGNPLYHPKSDISDFTPILNSILKETIRIRSPIPCVLRHCIKSTDVHDYKIPEDHEVSISITGTHLHSDYWDDPEKFNPSRFITGAKRIIEPYSFLPFSGGSHICHGGLQFSLVIGRIFISMLLSRFDLKLSPKANFTKDDEKMPNGLLLDYYLRTPKVVTNDNMSNSSNSSKLATDDNISEKEKKSTNARDKWQGLKAMIQQKEYRLYVIAGTHETTGKTATAATWFCEKAAQFNFKLGKSPYPADGVLPILQSDSKDFLILGVCMATYQGCASPSAREFIQWLEKCRQKILQGYKSLEKSLEHVNYFVFGCGDSNWTETYQKIPKFIDETLSMLGAKRICKMGYYDNSKDDLYEIQSEYYKSLAPRLMHSLPEIGNRKLRDVDSSAMMGSVAMEPQLSSSALKMEFVGDLSDPSAEIPANLPTIIPTGNPIHRCRVIKISCKGKLRLSSSDALARSGVLSLSDTSESTISNSSGNVSNIEQVGQPTYQSMDVQLEILPELEYTPGDSLLIYPQITKEILYQFFSLFTDYDPDMIIKWTSNIGGQTQRRFRLPLDVPLTLRNIFTSLVDITAQPTRQFLMNLSTIVINPQHEIFLNQLATKNENYQTWLKSHIGIRIIDVITLFPISSSSFDRLLEFLPILQPKSYPISSNWNYHSSYISIYITDSLPYNPILSQLLSIQKNSRTHPTVNVSLKYGTSLQLERLSQKNNVRPMLIITKGVSVAPFLGLLYETVTENLQTKAILLHCMNPNETKKNFVLRRSIRKLQKIGVLEKVHLVHPSQLNTILKETQATMWNYMNDMNCICYIAGCNGNILTDIMKNISSMVETRCTPLVYRGNKEYAQAFIEQLREAERFEEHWF